MNVHARYGLRGVYISKNNLFHQLCRHCAQNGTEGFRTNQIELKFHCERERRKDQQMSADLKFRKSLRSVDVSTSFLFCVVRYIKCEDQDTTPGWCAAVALRQPTMALWNGFALFQALRWAIPSFLALPSG